MSKKISPFKVRKSRRISDTLKIKFKVDTSDKKLSGKEVRRLALEAHAAIVAIEQVKPLYDRLDVITLTLLGQDLSQFGLQVVDNFAVDNKKFKGTFVSRFELKRS